MLIASTFTFPSAYAFQDSFAKILRKFPDWEYLGVQHYGTHRGVAAGYVGSAFSGTGLVLSVLASDADPATCHAILRADEWPAHVCTGEYNPQHLAAPLLKAALDACTPLSLPQPSAPVLDG